MTRVVMIGRTRLAVRALEIVLASGDEVATVIPDPTDTGADGWQPSLRGAATRRGVTVLDAANVNDPEVVARVAGMSVDFLLSFQAAPILRAPLIATPRVAALNLHYGPLPRYRGVSPIAWAIMNGETTHGVTLHHIDPGVDSGAIVTGREVAIQPCDTARDLYDRCVDAGIDLFAEVWPRIRGLDRVQGTPQAPEDALYYNRYALDFSDRRIRWNADCATIVNRIRALIFPPFQLPETGIGSHTSVDVHGVTWNRAPHRGRPGEILAANDGTLTVGAPGGQIMLGPISGHSGSMSDADLAAAGLVVGAMLD